MRSWIPFDVGPVDAHRVTPSTCAPAEGTTAVGGEPLNRTKRFALPRVEMERTAKRRREGLPDAVRFSAPLDEFEASEFPDLAPGARDSNLDRFKPLRLYFVEGEGDPLVSEISRADVKRYQSWRRTHRMGSRTGDVSAHTVGRDLRVLHRVFSFALDLDYIDANPAARVKATSPDARTYCILTDEELERLLAECSDPMLRLYVLLLAETGCRAYSEALHLRWEDVDLAGGFLHIVSGRDGHRTKSGASRYVPLTPRLRNALRDRFASYQMKAYSGKRSPWIFHHTRKHRLYEAGERIKDYKKAFSTAKAAAKFQDRSGSTISGTGGSLAGRGQARIARAGGDGAQLDHSDGEIPPPVEASLVGAGG
jgi:integrase